MFFFPALLAGVGLLLASRVPAQTFTTLHNFTGGGGGESPDGSVILSGNTLYGTATLGGSLGNGGMVFRVSTDGSGFTILHSFAGITAPPYTNSGGANPYAKLLLSSGILYGTAGNGGSSGKGSVFRVNTDGSGFTNLYSFTATAPFPPYGNSDGANPNAGLVLSGNTLYGTAGAGGNSGNGTVFSINTDGTGFKILHDFTASDVGTGANSDGAHPYTGLILSDDTLYGTANNGGSSGVGAVFSVKSDGTGFTNLYSFPALDVIPYQTQTNTDGASPSGELILSGGTLYGTAFVGGHSGNGAVFKVNTDGAGFLALYHFTATAGLYPLTNTDGAGPQIGVLSNNKLYGIARSGGSSGYGSVFAVNVDGSAFTNLHNFTDSDGSIPAAGLVLSGNTLYGATIAGGSFGKGTVFSISFAPQLTIASSGANVVLTWPTNVAGFDYTGYILQSAPASTGTFTNISGAASPYTNAITGSQKYFRLISN